MICYKGMQPIFVSSLCRGGGIILTISLPSLTPTTPIPENLHMKFGEILSRGTMTWIAKKELPKIVQSGNRVWFQPEVNPKVAWVLRAFRNSFAKSDCSVGQFQKEFESLVQSGFVIHLSGLLGFIYL